MYQLRVLFYSLLITVFFSAKTQATVTLPYFISNNMVLQQQAQPLIWGWTKANLKVIISTSWNKKKYTVTADDKGKWKINIETPVAGGPYEITITDGEPITLKNILIGEVWLCSGQSNMEMPMKGFRDQPIAGSNEAIFNANNDNIRFFTVPRSVQRLPQDTCKQQSWKLAEPETVSNFSATAYYFGRILQAKLKVPIGLINISYGGSPVEAFMDEASLAAFANIQLPAKTDDGKKINNNTPTTLYNGMLHPFLGFTVKGCIWYQGETNNSRAKQYETLFPAFVQMLRSKSNNDSLPFYFAQIAPYNYTNNATDSTPKFNSAYLRDAQRKALTKIPNSGMAVLMDIGEEFNIHPANKEIGSQRLAYMALAKTYSMKGFGHSSPLFDSLIINGNVATIKFSNAVNGLTSFGKPITNFEIAGANKVFRPARAIIYQGKVLISSPEIDKPVAVRYAFKDFVVGELFNTEGFPASSFRTDDW
ncbi:MAG: sialate O-acetylesterase [Chitinophagaceae bacterium]|nr:sialate O-acetylesterase [Chitinophagaceae bacterium]